MTDRREITRDDIMDMDAYVKVRSDRRREMNDLKRDRRVEVGPYATFYFESYATMLHQVQEMLYIERGGEAQIADELAAYNPLVPNGRELVATFMIEIEDPVRRDRELRRLAYIDRTIKIVVDGDDIPAVAEGDIDRTKEDGKTSSIHFLHFPVTDAQAEKLKAEGAKVSIAIEHENYSHSAGIPERVRAALASDLD